MLDICSDPVAGDEDSRHFDLCESMRLALLSMEQKITDRELDVEADIPEEPVMVEGVNDLITQVIYNLLENATKFAATPLIPVSGAGRPWGKGRGHGAQRRSDHPRRGDPPAV